MSYISHTIIYPKNRISMLKRHLHSLVYFSPIHNNQDIASTPMSIIKLMDKGNMVYKQNGILFSHKKYHFPPHG